MFRAAFALTALLCSAAPTFAQTSIAAEADVLAYGLPGYSGIFSATLPSKLQFAFGVGRSSSPFAFDRYRSNLYSS